MSEESRSILAARVTNIRARLAGGMLIILSLLLLVGVLYSVSFLRLEQAMVALEELVPQTSTLTAEQQISLLAETQAARQAMSETPWVWLLLVALGVFSVTIITIRSIAQPTERFTEAAERLAEGKLDERVEEEWADEFGRLAAALNEMADRLQISYTELEQQVAERTMALQRRSRQLEAAIQVAREAATTLDLGELLPRVVALISERFGWYHTGIFLLDPTGTWAELQAASSEGGKQMLVRGHRLRVGHEGIVGYVTGQGEPRIALDVGTSAVFLDNPDLPTTRSELALPLRARGEITGALDVQSREPEAFTEEDVTVLQTLADQVALAISNARLFQQVQESLAAERRAYETVSREAWQALFRARPGLSRRYDPHGILPSDGGWRTEMKLAVRSGESVAGEDRRTLAIPLKVRGQVIGVLDAHKPAEAGEWTAAEVALLEPLVDQLGVALDSARLYQDTRRRAARERRLAEVTARMRETLDVETVLKTAADEIYQALGLDEVVVRLVADEMDTRSAR
jgi:GAF domain-containing protein/HAMP domain-containing protein